MSTHADLIHRVTCIIIGNFRNNLQKFFSGIQKMRTVAVCLCVIAVLSAVVRTSAHAAEIVRIGGTGTGLGSMKLLGEAFEKNHPDVKILIVPGLGGAGGVMALLQGTLDIAVSGSTLNRDERISGITAVEYARTPFVFVVHKNVEKSGITTLEIEDIYAGRVRKWPGGKLIRIVLRPETDTDSRIVSALSPGMQKAIMSARNRIGKIIAVTDGESAMTVASTSGAIGTSTLSQVATEKLPLKILAFDGVVPNLSSVSAGSYRLFKSLYLVTTSSTTPAARLFVDFIHSPQGAQILSQSGNLVVAAPAAK